MVHLWVRAERRPNEERVGLMPDGAKALVARGFRVTVERSRTRAVPAEYYRSAGCELAPEGSWPAAPRDAIVFGLTEPLDDGTPLSHRHVMIARSLQEEEAGARLVERFRRGGGLLHDLGALTDEAGKVVAGFGYWAGYAGAAVALRAWLAQKRGAACGPLDPFPSAAALLTVLEDQIARTEAGRPSVLVTGALGRAGTGAGDLCTSLGLPVTRWDMAETAQGGPFPEVLEHDILLNCIRRAVGDAEIVGRDVLAASRRLCLVADIEGAGAGRASPVRLSDGPTDWENPARRVHADPPLDLVAIDDLPALLPLEASRDYARQLLPALLDLDDPDQGAWGRAGAGFRHRLAALSAGDQ